MSRATRMIAILAAAGLALACAGEQNAHVTAPDVEDLGTLAATHHDPNHDGGPGGGNGGGGGDGGGGDDDGSTSTVTMTDGMVATDQPVDIKENKRTLTMQTGGSKILVELAMVATHDTYISNLGACEVDQPEKFTEEKKKELLGYLVDAVQDRNWRMEVDKRSLGSPSTDNAIGTTFTDDDTGALISILVGSPELMPLSSTVVEDPTDTFTLSSGAVRVADRTESGAKNTLKIACPNEDLITVALQR